MKVALLFDGFGLQCAKRFAGLKWKLIFIRNVKIATITALKSLVMRTPMILKKLYDQMPL
jgi:hypothetical protein